MRGVQASTWAGLIMFDAVMAGGVAGAASAVGDDGPFVGSSSPAASFAGYKCVYRTTGCPERLVLADEDGNHLGCSVTGHRTTEATECTGDCYTCWGGHSSGRFCMASPGNTCVNDPTVGRFMHCGGIRKHESGCSGNQSTGVPTTPNGCYCKTSSPFTNIGEPCIVQECLP